MNYQRIYDQFINDRRLKEPNLTGYTETHHILPVSLGGNNSPENLIKLTGRDHVFSHALLAKIYGGPMFYAYWMMINGTASYRARKNGELVRVPSHVIDSVKRKRAMVMAETRSGEAHHFFGKRRPKDTREKISKSLKQKYKKGYVSPNLGRKMTESQKKEISDRVKEKYRNGMVHPMQGKKHSEEARIKISLAQTGKLNNNYGKPLRKDHARKIGESQIGIKNHFADKRNLKFENKSGVSYIGIRSDFIRKYGLGKASVARLINGRQRQHKGWLYIGEVE